MNHQQAEVTAPKATVVAIISPPQLVINRSQRILVPPMDESENVDWVRKISMVILVSHAAALLVYLALIEVWAGMGPVFLLAVFAYLLGIISSTIVVCATSELLFAIGGILYAGVGIFNAIILYAWFDVVDFSQENEVVLWMFVALPNIVGLFSCLDGSMETLKVTCKWDNQRRCAPKNPPIPVTGDECVPAPEQIV